MKLVMATILFMSACLFVNAQQPIWNEFRSTEGGFSVLMPGVPAPNKVSLSTASGLKEANMFTSKDENSHEYLVAYSNYTGRKSGEASTDKLFDKVRDGILLAQQGKLLSEAAITLDGHNGRAIAVERPDGAIVVARFYLVDNRFYQLSVEAKTTGSEPQTMRRFLDSFKLLPLKQ